MTNTMRWGLTSLTALGLMVAGGAFVGCSSSSTVVTPAEDSGTDTAVVDSGTDSTTPDTADAADTAVQDTTAETPPAVPDRKVTIVHSSPDAGAQLFCFGAGAANTLGKALIIGVPNATAPTDASQYTGFPYGTIAPISIPADGLISKAEVDSLPALTIYAFPIGATNPLTAAAHDANAMLTACSTAFAKFKSDAGIDTTKFISFSGAKLSAGTSTVLYATGCASASTTAPECAGQGLKLGYSQLNLTDPTFPTGDAGAGKDISFHFFHASPFPGVAAAGLPGFQAGDVWLFPMTAAVAGDAGADAGDAGGTPSSLAGTPMKVATNVSYGSLVGVSVATSTGDAGTDAADAADGGTSTSTTAAPFVLPAAADAASTLVVLMPTGTAAPCVSPAGAPSAACSGWTLPVKSFLPFYAPAPINGGFIDKTHQLLLLSGSPLDTNPATASLRIGFANVSHP